MRKPIGKVKNESALRKQRRKLSIRKKISGTAEIPRLSPFKSNKNLFVQVIDDEAQKTILSVQSFGKKSSLETSLNMESVKVLGKILADKLTEKGIKRVVFDRNGNKYTGVLKNLAETVRENGIQI